MWYQNRSGLYSAAPRTLALTAPSDLLPKDRITSLIDDARKNIDMYASKYANGNSKLAQGIKAQHQISLDLYEQDKQLPSELNLGKLILYHIHTFEKRKLKCDCRTGILRTNGVR
jgi:hypothetical protein